MLHSEDAEARRIAVDGIGKKVGKLAIADLEAAGERSATRASGATAIRWLGQLKDPSALELLTERLRDPDEGVRAAAGSRAREDRHRQPRGARQAGARTIARSRSGSPGSSCWSPRIATTAELTALADDPEPMVAVEAAIERGTLQLAPGRSTAPPAPTTGRSAPGPRTSRCARSARTAPSRSRSRLADDPELAVRLAAARVLAHSGDRARRPRSSPPRCRPRSRPPGRGRSRRARRCARRPGARRRRPRCGARPVGRAAAADAHRTAHA